MNYHSMCGQEDQETGTKTYESWGTLANFLTRFKAFDMQVKQEIPFQAVIEDDVKLKPGFGQFLRETVKKHYGFASNASDLVILGHFGEGYLTSLAAARKIVQTLNAEGIIGCPDQQLNYMMNDQIQRKTFLADSTPWTVVERPGAQIAKTAKLTAQEKRTLQNLRSSDAKERSVALSSIDLFGREELATERVEGTSRPAYFQHWMQSAEYETMVKADMLKTARQGAASRAASANTEAAHEVDEEAAPSRR